MEVAFWLAAAVVLYAYLGYPALILLAARLWPAPEVRKGEVTPPVSLLTVARNEEACLEEKLRNVLDLDYPRDRLEVIVASDGSTDRTEAIASASRTRSELESSWCRCRRSHGPSSSKLATPP